MALRKLAFSSASLQKTLWRVVVITYFRFAARQKGGLAEGQYVELEGIEPSSAKGLQPAIRPFPIYDLTAVIPSGPLSKAPLPDLSLMSAVFRAVSGLSLRSFTASVAGLQ